MTTLIISLVLFLPLELLPNGCDLIDLDAFYFLYFLPLIPENANFLASFVSTSRNTVTRHVVYSRMILVNFTRMLY
jgi:hypothetical protein